MLHSLKFRRIICPDVSTVLSMIKAHGHAIVSRDEHTSYISIFVATPLNAMFSVVLVTLTFFIKLPFFEMNYK